MALRPNDVQATTYLGAARWRQGRVDEAFAAFAEALAHYAEALRLAPDYPDAHFNLATALAAAGRLEEAGQHYGEFIRLRPGDAEGHAALANVRGRQGKTTESLRNDP